MNDGGPVLATIHSAATGRQIAVHGGLTLRDYFAATIEPLESLSSMEAVCALAGRPRPHDAVFKNFQEGKGKRTDPKPEQWLDYFRWWADADAAMRYIRADAMMEARKPKQENQCG